MTTTDLPHPDQATRMEFVADEDVAALGALVGEIATDWATLDRIVEVERHEGGFDGALWRTLAGAGVIGAVLPESVGGGGLGASGLVAVAEQLGRRVAQVPFGALVAAGAMPIAEFGSDELVARLLDPVLAGEAVVTGAFDAAAQGAGVTGRFDGAVLVLDGEAVGVPAAPVAAAVVVPVELADGALRVVVVDLRAGGVEVEQVESTARGSMGIVRFSGARVEPADVLVGDGQLIRDWIVQRARLALCGQQLGVCTEALTQTAAYVSTRQQFGRPLSTNQAVAVRAADAYLDTRAIGLTTTRAAWLLDSGRADEAASAVLVANYWASRGGLRVVHATQHLHGGIGADVDYPIHRYFLFGRQAAFSLGTADELAAEIGALLPQAPPIGAPL